MVQWTWKVFQSASASSDNRSECYIEGCAQSVVGFGLETHTLKVCAAPAHTIQLEVANQQYVPEWSTGHGKCFKVLRPLETTDPSAILRVVHNRLWALGSKQTL